MLQDGKDANLWSICATTLIADIFCVVIVISKFKWALTGTHFSRRTEKKSQKLK